MRDLQAIQKTLDRAKLKLLSTKNSVFLTTILFSLKHEWDDTLDPPTASVDGLTIFIHPDFWMSLTPEERIFLLAHEAWHVAFNHIVVPDYIDRKRHNDAADYVINIMLTDAGYTMPKGGLLDNQYRGMSTMQVYNLLPENPPNQQPQCGGNVEGIGRDIRAPGKDGSGNSKNDIKEKIQETILRAHTLSKIQNKDAGHLPGEIQVEIDALINPKLDWRTILQNHMTEFDKTDYSFKRPNRRYMPEFYLPSLYGESIGEIAVAVDTSGSVSASEFSSFLSEINDIKEKLQPSLTTIIDFDTSIKHVHKIGPDESVKDLPFSGRGGTDLDCVFEYFEKNNSPKLLIVFSDLWCERIENDPGYPVIWICVNNDRAKVNFGKLIHYET
jgi:predicted metal-dependent peptidase